jgi:hypothetical protein
MRLSEAQIDEAVELYDGAQWHARTLAARYGVSTQTMRSRLLDRGVRMKRRGFKRTIDRQGYVRIWVDPNDKIAVAMARKAGTVGEHRLVMAHHLGRSLEQHETVHHINGDRQDNRIENLQLRSGRHGPGVKRVCQDCGSSNIVSSML